MVGPEEELDQAWKDFPKGLKVLLVVEEDGGLATFNETKTKLEAMEYVVSPFCNWEDALEAVSKKAESFHVAIIEVTTTNSSSCFRFLETARDLPTIVISSVRRLSTTMKCIALGAVEFLQKPLSEDKLRNIWQHVVHKVFNAGGRSMLPKSLKPIKETVVSILGDLHGHITASDSNNSNSYEADIVDDDELVIVEGAGDRFRGPSTPQLDQQDTRQPDQDRSGSKEEEERDLRCSKSKFADNTNYINNVGIVRCKKSSDEEVNSTEGDECSTESKEVKKKKKKKKRENIISNRTRSTKIKVDWTPDLHRRFVQAVDQLGIDQAIPSKILEVMKVEGLTRHNVASHLQKYRMHKRHILPKDHHFFRDFCQASYVHIRPSTFFNAPNPLRTNTTAWGYPPSNYYHRHLGGGGATWGTVAFPAAWHLQLPHHHEVWQRGSAYNPPSTPPYPPPINADAWGCPVASSSLAPHYSNSPSSPPLPEYAIDEVVKEALSKPWLPLPLGLKPPCIDSVVEELKRQGIQAVPTMTTQQLPIIDR